MPRFELEPALDDSAPAEDTSGTRTMGTAPAEGKAESNGRRPIALPLIETPGCPRCEGLDFPHLLECPRSQSQRKRQRLHVVRGETVSIRRTSKRALRAGAEELPPEADRDVVRPRTRGDCKDGYRPCPFVSCRYHLYLDVQPETGSVKINFPGLEPDQLSQTCALDVADAGGATLEEVGRLMNLTRERVRQIESRATDRNKRLRLGLQQFEDHLADLEREDG